MAENIIQEYYSSLNSLSSECPDLFKKTYQKVYFKETLERNYYDPYISSSTVTTMLPQTSFTIVGEGMGDRTTGWFTHSNNEKTLGNNNYDEKVLNNISHIIKYRTYLQDFESYNADPYIMLWLLFWNLGFSDPNALSESSFKKLERIASVKSTLEEKIKELYKSNVKSVGEAVFWNDSFINFDKTINQLTPFQIKSDNSSDGMEKTPTNYTERLWTESPTLQCNICHIEVEALHSLKPETAIMSYFMCEKCLENYYSHNHKTVSLLAQQDILKCRRQASSSLFASPEVLKTLAFDSDRQVRENILANPNSDEETIMAVRVQNAI